MTLTLAKYFRNLNWIVFALALGIILFSLMAVYLNGNTSIAGSEDNIIMYGAAMFLFVFALFGGQHFYKKILSDAFEKSLGTKLAAYQSATIVRLALFEGTALFCTVMYLTSSDLGFLLITGICVFAFRFLKPTKEKLLQDLTLSKEETKRLNNANEEFELIR